MIIVRVVSSDNTSGGGGASEGDGVSGQPQGVETAAAQSESPAVAKLFAEVTGVPAAVLDKVGKGDVASLPKRLKGQPELTDGDKPLVLFIGSEACPHCGTQRWAVAVALSRFGTFSGLKTSPAGSSKPTTLSFHGATYVSTHLAFHAVELATSTGERQDTMTPQQEEIMERYGTGSVPFLDFGNRYIAIGSSYSSKAFSGKTAFEIAAALSDPRSSTAKAIDGGANMMTAAICAITNNQPREVCSSDAAKAYAGAF